EPVDLRFLRLTQKPDKEPPINPIKQIRFNFVDKDLTQLFGIARQYEITPYQYGQCIFILLLHKYTSQNNFAFSYPVAIREHSELCYGVGVNMNIAPTNIIPDAKIIDLIKYVKDITLKCNDKHCSYRYYPINQLMEDHNHKFLDVSFIKTNLKDYKFTFNNVQTLTINSDFNIDLPNKLLFEQEIYSESLNFRVRYDCTQIEETTLSQFIRHYQKLFLDVLADLEQGIINRLISQYPVLTDSEYQTIIYKWNQTDQIYSEHKTIHQLFEEQVQRTPNNIALVYEDIVLTYKDLNERSNQLAHYLRNTYNIKVDDLIALCLTRNEYMLIAILAVLKSGGAYVPIDSEYPLERLKFIVQDTQSKIVLTNQQYLDKLPKDIATSLIGVIFIAVDTDAIQTKLNNQLIENPYTNITSHNLAYIIYTSGTSGTPKGVMVEHIALSGFCLDNSYLHWNNLNCVLGCSSYVFDGSIFDLFSTLINGAKLVLVNNQDILNHHKLRFLIKNHAVDVLFVTTAIFSHYVELFDDNPLNNLKYLLFGGEQTDLSVIKRFFTCNNTTKLIHMYGPTENVTFATFYYFDKYNLTLSIGKRLMGKKLYLLDNNFNPLPVGAIGELYIGGAGIARGYLNQPELTKAQFINNPFQSPLERSQKKNARLYKTGDLVRYLPDGNIEYIGRIDGQVKINGNRIELAEIESVLMGYPGIKYTLVLVHECVAHNAEIAINKLLVAYYLGDNQLDGAVLRNYLAGKLPGIMIPQ
ncbi:MAG: amino acid adenylation domain-containing protein, partial [Burkholderiales bacterium]|nr:amino acid adenylation domain-containing protein [Burkholderiales bacterium]